MHNQKNTCCIICSSVIPQTRRARNGTTKYCSSKCVKTAYRKQHPEKDAEAKKRWVENNPEKRKQSSKEYQQKNKSYYNAYSSLRSRKAKQAKPFWLSEWDLFFIEELYDLASLRGLEVDHIVPITHKVVCGLHVPWNLQLLTRSENAKKSNKLDEDVICIIKKTSEKAD